MKTNKKNLKPTEYKEFDISLQHEFTNSYIVLFDPEIDYIKKIYPLMEEKEIFVFIFLTKSIAEVKSVNWKKELPKSNYIAMPILLNQDYQNTAMEIVKRAMEKI